MIEYLILSAIILFLTYNFFRLRQIKNELEEWDPFGWNLKITTELICDTCGMKMVRLFKKGDFVFGKTKDKCLCVCKRKKCTGLITVCGIYYAKRKTKEELKWEKLEAKWR